MSLSRLGWLPLVPLVPPPARLGVPDPTHGPITGDDLDGDGVPNGSDNCPMLATKIAIDYDGRGGNLDVHAHEALEGASGAYVVLVEAS